MCMLCEIETSCATCLFSVFRCAKTQVCGLHDEPVHEENLCEEWQPMLIQMSPGAMPQVFGGLDETPCH